MTETNKKKPVWSEREGNLQMALWKNPENKLFKNWISINKSYMVRGTRKQFKFLISTLELKYLIKLIEKFDKKFKLKK